jgi:hypothetical protein
MQRHFRQASGENENIYLTSKHAIRARWIVIFSGDIFGDVRKV